MVQGLDPAAPPWYRRRSDHTLLVLHCGGLFGIAGFFNPRNNDQVLERARDIQYSSKTRFNTTRVKDLEQFNEALRRVLARLPTSMKDDPDVRLLADASRGRRASVVQLINRRSDLSSQAKDREFSHATVRALWESDRGAVRRTMASPEWPDACAMAGGLRTFDLAP